MSGPGDTVLTGTGKVDLAQIFKCTTADREVHVGLKLIALEELRGHKSRISNVAYIFPSSVARRSRNLQSPKKSFMTGQK